MEGFCRSPEQEGFPSVPRLILPKTAFKDVRSFLRLEEEKLRVLDELFGTPASIAPRSPEFIREVAKRLRLDISTTEAVVLVCQFLLTVAEEGNPPEGILNDLREFVAQHASPEEKDVVAAPDQKRQALVSLLTPKPERTRALKVEYLAHGPHPTVDSFRTVCELRPVFECPEGRETIVGYVPTVLLEVKVSDIEGQGKTVLLYLTTEMLKSLQEVVRRTEEKLEAIRAKFDKELLHD
jgi:hypothetical protein